MPETDICKSVIHYIIHAITSIYKGKRKEDFLYNEVSPLCHLSYKKKSFVHALYQFYTYWMACILLYKHWFSNINRQALAESKQV